MSAISINNNLLAANTANSLTSHYRELAVSTQRLSSGLRINSAADDAAGLAIRELMRADISALRQGMRNVNDGISMIQTFDGALSVIDEKLIRMKELAEQAATGTYDSTQRLMIDSEFQAMGDEIDRIARATDFNGIKLLDGKGIVRENKALTRVAIPADPNDPNSPEYDVKATTTNLLAMWPGETATQSGAWDLSGINEPDKLASSTNITISNDNILMIGNQLVMVTPKNIGSSVPPGSTLNIQYDVNNGWTINGYAEGTTPTAGGNVLVQGTTQRVNGQYQDTGFVFDDPNTGIGITTTLYGTNGKATFISNNANVSWTAPNVPSFSVNTGTITSSLNGNELSVEIDLGNNNIVKGKFNVSNGEDRALASVSLNLTSKEIKIVPDPIDPGPTGPTDPDNPLAPNYKIPDDVVRIHFGAGADKKEDFYDIHMYDATCIGLGLGRKTRAAGDERIDIQTQENAQNALVQINDAIVQKDKIRAEYGAMQNRMENTMTNLATQAENLQTSESRISDAEIATEMMNFVRNQILTQSAVAMLAQANSVPQMVMSLIN